MNTRDREIRERLGRVDDHARLNLAGRLLKHKERVETLKVSMARLEARIAALEVARRKSP